jgi:hypothetical protein
VAKRPSTNLEDIQADCATRNVHVRVVAWSVEFDGRRDVWIVGREGNRDPERQVGVDLVPL